MPWRSVESIRLLVKLILALIPVTAGARGGLVERLRERLAPRHGPVARGGDRDRGAAGDRDHETGDDRQQTSGGDGAQKLHQRHDLSRGLRPR